MSSEIKINRNQRRWYKYGKLIIGLAIAAAAAIIIGCIIAAAAGGKGKQQVADGQQTESVSETVTDENGNVVTTEAATESQVSGSTLALKGEPVAEEFTQAAAYKNSVFVGDIFVNDLLKYGLIDEYYIWTSNYFTLEKAANYVNDVAELKPEKLFLMFGFDDSAEASSDETAAAYEKLVKSVKEVLPETKIYLISELPVSKSFDEEDGNITQAVLDEVNSKMEKKASELGVTYINAADVFKDGTNIKDGYTNDGYHIKEEYHPFVLNGIAGLI